MTIIEYEVLAAVLKDTKLSNTVKSAYGIDKPVCCNKERLEQWRSIVCFISKRLRETNDNYNTNKFLTACEFLQDYEPKGIRQWI